MTQRIRPHALDQSQGAFGMPRGQTGSVSVWDEATPLGVFGQLRFEGDGVQAAAQAGYAEVTVQGGGAGGQGLFHTDDGAAVGTGTAVDWGARLLATLSGSVLRADAEPPVTGTLALMDEGVLLGSVESLDFVGSQVAASVTGRHGRVVFSAAPAGGQLGMYFTDEGAPQATGTVLDAVGGLLAADASGATLRVTAPFYGARVRQSAPTSLTNGANTTVVWDTEDYDYGGFFNTGVVNGNLQFTVPAGITGVFLVGASMLLSGGTNSRAELFVVANGTGIVAAEKVRKVAVIEGMEAQVSIGMAPGWTARVQAFQNAGTMRTDPDTAGFWIRYLGRNP